MSDRNGWWRQRVADIVAQVRQWWADSEDTRQRAAARARAVDWRMVGAFSAIGAVLVGLVAFAVVSFGVLSAALFGVGLVAGASGPPVAILLLRDGLPLGGVIGRGLAIAAQIAFGQAALVERDDGGYEWTLLREDDDGYVARLEDGTRVDIAADDGALFAFGFGQLAVVSQKTDRNMSRWTVPDTPGTSEQPAEVRGGVDVLPARKRQRRSWLVSLRTIQRAVRGSASSALVRRGRDKALEETGGTQQLSQLWTMAFATVLLIVGFILASATFML